MKNVQGRPDPKIEASGERVDCAHRLIIESVTQVKVLFVNQFYCPDPAATGQLMADQAEELCRRGHEVHVLCGSRAYSGGTERYPSSEVYKGVHIHRVRTTGFGRINILGRIIDYVSFYILAVLRAFFLPRMDVCVCLTTPPFIGIVGALLRTFKKTQFVLWVMDIYPDIAVTYGILREESRINRALRWVSKSLYQRASKIISLGEVMNERLIEGGADPDKIVTVHNWVPREVVVPKPREASLVRQAWSLNGTPTVMYSGNIGLGHDLSPFIQAAARLEKEIDFRMLIVGKGKGRVPMEELCKEQGSKSVSFYPPQALESLADTLAAGDIHLVSQRLGTQGLIVPSKVYGVLAAGRPTVFVGPEDCEPAQIFRACGSGEVVPPGNVEAATASLRHLLLDSDLRTEMGTRARNYYESHFGRAKSTGLSADTIEGVCPKSEKLSVSLLKRFQTPAIMVAVSLLLLSLVLWRSKIASVVAAPFLDLWNGGLAQALHHYAPSGSFWTFLVGSFALTVCLTPLIIVMAKKLGAVDHGGHRKINQKAIPLLGGLGVAAPFLILCCLSIAGATDILIAVSHNTIQLIAILVGSLCILCLGILDDTRGMRARNKFLAQVAVALMLCFFGFWIKSVSIPMLGTINFHPVFGITVTILWIVGLTNALNLIDGLDGLASGISLIAVVGLGFIAAIHGQVLVALLCTALFGSLAAFLIFNFHPAKIFLGDTGSMFLGFTLAAMSLTASMKMSGTVIFLAPILALGLPIFEVALSMLRRFMRGLPVSRADANHIHHRLLERGFSQRRVALILYAGGLVCLLAALFSATGSAQKASTMLLPLGMYLTAMLAIVWLAGYARSIKKSGEIRKRNVLYQAFVQYATMGLSNDVSALGINSIFEIARKEMQLAYLSASFLDPVQSIASIGFPTSDTDGAFSEPVREIQVSSGYGQQIRIRCQFDGEIEQRRRDEILMHLGNIFERATIKRSNDMIDSKPDRRRDRRTRTKDRRVRRAVSVVTSVSEPEWEPVVSSF